MGAYDATMGQVFCMTLRSLDMIHICHIESCVTAELQWLSESSHRWVPCARSAPARVAYAAAEAFEVVAEHVVTPRRSSTELFGR